MDHYLLRGFTCSLLLLFLAGFCMAATEQPGSVIYVQGGACTLTDGSDGMTMVTIVDIVPYIHISEGEKNQLLPAEQLSGLTFPLNAALVVSGTNDESASIVAISNLSLSDEDKTLTLQVTPRKYYEGSALKAFASENQQFGGSGTGGSVYSGLYIEQKPGIPENVVGHICPEGMVCIE